MSCGCGQTPCGCEASECEPDPCSRMHENQCADVNPDPHCGTKCDLDKCNNLWYVSDQPGNPQSIPQCKLDQMTYEQVVEVLERNPFAARDLMRVTSDPCLLELARTVRLRVAEQEDNRIVENRLMANSLPYYTVFGGNTGGDPGHGGR